MRGRALVLLAALAALSCPRGVPAPRATGLAYRPTRQFVNLVAGNGEQGFRDGDYAEAIFSVPLGLALDPNETRLYVADAKNNRIRVVRLDQGNRVETLAGTGASGDRDGPVGSATFTDPAVLAYLPGDRLLVAPSGEGPLRMIDLAKGRVTKPPFDVPPGAIYALLHVAKENALYVSQPMQGILRRVDLATNQVSKLLEGSPQLPQPAALTLFNGAVAIADLERPGVYVLTQDGTLESAAEADLPAVSIAAAGDRLYAAREAPEALVRLHPGGPWSLRSAWGGSLELPPGVERFFSFARGMPAGFLASRKEERKLFIALPWLHTVVSFQDYDQERLRETNASNSQNITDFEYPLKKPEKTFRMLLVGDSRSFYTSVKDTDRWGFGHDRMETLAKRTEALLNTRAAILGVETSYEVLSLGRVSHDCPFVWPYHEVPRVADAYDVDLVLYWATPQLPFSDYFRRPFDADGVPVRNPDSEHLLLSRDEMVKTYPKRVQTVFHRLEAAGFVSTGPDGRFGMNAINVIAKDPEVFRLLGEELGRPFGLLARRLRESKPSRRFEIAFMPFAKFGPPEADRRFWRDVAGRNGIPYLDLTRGVTALRPALYPLGEGGGYDHLNSTGALSVAILLTEELIAAKQIPWKS